VLQRWSARRIFLAAAVIAIIGAAASFTNLAFLAAPAPR
jgi:hypothetical protein